MKKAANKDELNEHTTAANLNRVRSPEEEQAANYDAQKDINEEAPEFEENDSDLTQDDLEALGPVDLSMDLGDDEALRQRTHPVDFAGEDLDVPGSELDDESEDIGEEDEENNTYSLGGDNHEE